MIQHACLVNEHVAESIYAKGATLTPTTWVATKIIKNEFLSRKLVSDSTDFARSHLGIVQKCVRSGVPILFGTDPILPEMHGRNYEELWSLQNYGLSTLETLYAATGLAAKCYGEHEIGTLQIGKIADIVVCEKHVLEDLSKMNSNTIVEVFKDGIGYRSHLMDTYPVFDYSKFLLQNSDL
jgi:imidazolonepropionase-like amidohydrolase